MRYDFRNYRGRVVFGLVVLCIAGVTLTCSDNKGNCEPEEEETGCRPLTRNALLNCLCIAYEGEDVEAYADLLHEQFLFCFTPEVAESIGLPPDETWWGKTDDVASTRNMFDDEAVTRVRISLDEPTWFWCQVVRQNPAPDPPDTLEGFCTRVRPDIRVTIEEPGKEPLILLVDRSWLDIEVVPDPDEEGLWQVITMEESRYFPGTQGISTLDAEGEMQTWGMIKAMFR
jgi:hypothetical protein